MLASVSSLGASATAGRRLLIALLFATVAIRLGAAIFAGHSEIGDDSGDVVYHAQLIHDPVGHLVDSAPDVRQYAPYLGIAEWVTAAPAIALGASDAVALRIGSVLWDLLGFALLLAALASSRRATHIAVLLWGLSPLVWPASAVAGQDETIAAAFVAGAVFLVTRRHRRAALVLLVIGLFTAKVLIAPVLVAMMAAPRDRRAREVFTIALALVVALGMTYAFSGHDGLWQQLSYRSDNVAFSMTAWSPLVLHHLVTAEFAYRASLAIALAAAVGIWFAWRRLDPSQQPWTLAAAVLVSSFAVLAVSNPEYLVIAAPVAIVACVSAPTARTAVLVAVGASLAWSVNGTYHAIRRDPTASRIAFDGYPTDMTTRLRLLGGAHFALSIALSLVLLATAWHFLRSTRATRPDV